MKRKDHLINSLGLFITIGLSILISLVMAAICFSAVAQPTPPRTQIAETFKLLK